MTEKFNPCEGSPQTKAQMGAIIELRNSEALYRFVKELADGVGVGRVCRCPCGYDMLEIMVHEVVEINVCPSCRRVTQTDPDNETVIYEGYRSST